MTDKNKKIYDTVIQYFEMNGYCPSYEDLVSLTGYSKGTVKSSIDVLLSEGLLSSNNRSCPRAFTITGYKFVKE